MTPSSLVPDASATCPVRCIFLDQTGLWASGALYGKIASVLRSTGTGGGQNKPYLDTDDARWPTTA